MIGNATLLGIGYMLMRRPVLAIASLLGSIGLLALIAVYPYVLVWRVLLPVWWAAVVAHTWWSAPQKDPVLRGVENSVWRKRVLAAACLILVLLAWVRFDSWAITRDAEVAHADGDCDRAVASLRWLGAAHGVVHSSVASRGEEEREACELLIDALDTLGRPAAAEKLEAYLDHPGSLWDGAGPERAGLLLEAVMDSNDEVLEDDDPALATMEDAFAQLSVTLQSTPGQSERVGEVVESFLAALVEAPPCRTKEIDTWLFAQTWEEPELTEMVAPEADQVPIRMFGCADELGSTSVEAAYAAYQEFLTVHPEHALATKAAESLLSDGGYCEYPAAYPGAPAYEGGGPHAMWTVGIDPDEYDFPGSWQAETTDETVLVVCAEGPERGSLQQTCAYEPGESQLEPRGFVEVDFYASEFTVEAYELRSGELVADYSAEVGDPCPGVLEYGSSPYLDIVPDEYDSDYSDADVRAIFDRLMD
ncbi:hypothetical protein [Nocardiopsis ganjiahuensis]|uniref:hypothetical protein n=1 Tax=Nocardiopsis ganjiahuensis TaxID=239984 RepID=UPI0012687EE6|nr:hypothetical protein [Nocardiopsis ganjiahuensis]